MRQLDSEVLQNRMDAARQGQTVSVGLTGFYGQMRNWMGTENLSVAFYDYPDMIHDLVEHWAELIVRQIARLPKDFPIDQIGWWEDMACKNGPLVSPRTFREFLQPGCHRVMQATRSHGVAISVVDCDGNPHDLVANWLRAAIPYATGPFAVFCAAAGQQTEGSKTYVPGRCRLVRKLHPHASRPL